jgi:hypothetical protein
MEIEKTEFRGFMENQIKLQKNITMNEVIKHFFAYKVLFPFPFSIIIVTFYRSPSKN